MPASAFLAFSALARIASLNLCTDEYLLLLARPGEVASVSYLSQDPQESPLWPTARAYKGNRGSLEDVLAMRPTIILTMGGGGRATKLIAPRLHIKAIDLPFGSSLDDVERNLRVVATALGEPQRATPWIEQIKQLRRTLPRQPYDSIFISGHGDSLSPGSLGAQWLQLAGFRQRALPGGKATLETLLTHPPSYLIRSNYRSGEMSGGLRWLDHPIVRHAASKQLVADGRRWTCLGPLMIGEIKRLRKSAP